MKTRTPLIRAALAVAMVGSAFAIERVPHAAGTAAGVTIEARAPLHATLLPELSVVASASDPDLAVATNLAVTAALPVTLMPTVHVVASRDEFAALDMQRALDAADAALLAAAD